MEAFLIWSVEFSMDNDAFTALVRERAKVKSTKEIAREAVEAEFKRGKKKRKHRGDNEYSSGDEDDRPKHRKSSESRSSDDTADGNGAVSNYRDRAKERREGKGDPMTLTRELDMFTGSTTAPKLIRKEAKQDVGYTISTLEEAKDFLLRYKLDSSGNLVADSFPSFIDVILNRISAHPRPLRSRTAATSIRRSRLVMKADGISDDYRKAWEIPRNELVQNQSSDNLLYRHLDLQIVRGIASVVEAKRSCGSQSQNNSTGASIDTSDDDEDIFGGLVDD